MPELRLLYGSQKMPKSLMVNEMFASIQGEGFWTGTPCYFIRLSGCNRKCDFCDTFHEDGVEMNFNDTMAKMPGKFRHLIITGGEPTIQENLVEFIKGFDHYKVKIHIETNGTRPDVLEQIQCIHNTWITISPKEELDWKTYAWADELKFVVGSEKDLEYPHEVWRGLKKFIYKSPSIYLQPMSNKKEAIDLCYQECLKHPDKFSLSVQMHKLVGVV